MWKMRKPGEDQAVEVTEEEVVKVLAAEKEEGEFALEFEGTKEEMEEFVKRYGPIEFDYGVVLH